MTPSPHSFFSSSTHSQKQGSQLYSENSYFFLPTLLISSFLVSFSSIAYELLLATYASFLVGTTVLQYMFVVSLMMASMGIGALIAYFFSLPIYSAFLAIEVILSIFATIALPLLYYFFARQIPTIFPLFFFVLFIGILAGLELPLLSKLTRAEKSLSQILFFDYLGGGLAGFLFPLWLIPQLGIFRVSSILACLNAFAALLIWRIVKNKLGKQSLGWFITCCVVLLLSLFSLWNAETFRHVVEAKFFQIH